MSNLYKQWYVRTDAADARVIDSDALMAEYLVKNTRREPEAPAEAKEGFTEGLVAEAAGNVIKAEPEIDYVAQAMEDAARVLDDAKSKVEEMIAQAQAEVDEIQKAAREQGYRDGKESQERELDELRRQLEGTYQNRAQALESDYREKRDSMEKDLVEAIIEVFNRVFHIQFDNKKDILMYLIDNAIMDIEGEKQFRIKVAAGNVLFLENHKEEILDRVGHDIELEILSDSTMDGNECTIETDSGVFDCSLGTQLENLIKDIRSLCS